MDPYEALGRLYCDFHAQLEEYRKLLNLVGRIKAGEVDPAHVEILPNDSWRIAITLDGANLKVAPNE